MADCYSDEKQWQIVMAVADCYSEDCYSDEEWQIVIVMRSSGRLL